MNERNTATTRNDSTVFIDFTTIAKTLSMEQRKAVVADPNCMLVGVGSINLATNCATEASWWLAEPKWRDYDAAFGGQRWSSDGPRIVEIGSRADAEEAALGVALACEALTG